MEFLRKWWAQIGAFMSKLSFEGRALLVMIVAVLLVVIVALMVLTSSSPTVPLVAVPPDRVIQVKSRLEAAGIKVEAKGTQLLVPTDRRDEAWAILAQNDLLSADASSAFDQMISSQNLFDSNARIGQKFLLAKQKVLGLIMAKMAGVKSAEVMLSPVEQQGFGQTAVRPSASVNVVMYPGKSVDKHLVEALAGLVSGAVSGMKPQDVVVIDANMGRQFTVKSAEDMGADGGLEYLQHLEGYVHKRIADLLYYIPGVIVAVNVRTDNIVAHERTEKNYAKAPPVATETAKTTERRNATAGAEPGVRPNTGLSIDNGGGANNSEKTEETSTNYRDLPLVSQDVQRLQGQTPKKISVTVNVPRSFFVGVYKHGKTGDTADPDDDKLKPIVEEQLVKIKEQVKPMISTDIEGVIAAQMIPDAGMLMPNAADAQSHVILASVMGSEWVQPALIGVLVLVAVTMMLLILRWTTRTPKMPTAEELAGVPAMLPVEDDLIGEADAQDPSMAGVELDEGQIRSRKIAEQIGEMVKSNPGEAATLFNRWIRKED